MMMVVVAVGGCWAGKKLGPTPTVNLMHGSAGRKQSPPPPDEHSTAKEIQPLSLRKPLFLSVSKIRC